MKIKISEMFGDSIINIDPYVQTKDNSINKNKIKRMTLNKISSSEPRVRLHYMIEKRLPKRIIIVATAIVSLMLCAFAANAATGGKLFGAILINDENRHIAKEQRFASMVEAHLIQKETYKKQELVSNIINANQLKTISAGYISNIAIEEIDGAQTIPELLTDNGNLVIFTQQNEAGWQLQPGEQLTITYKLDLETSKLSDPTGETMQIGYIKNGELIEGFTEKAKEFTYTITADETGEYYFYVKNYSAGYILILTGTVSQH